MFKTTWSKIFVALAVLLVIGILGTILTLSQPDAVFVPFYNSQKALNAARDLIFEKGWKHQSESGDNSQITFVAIDQSGRSVTFRFRFITIGAKVTVEIEGGSSAAEEEILRQLSGRLGGK